MTHTIAIYHPDEGHAMLIAIVPDGEDITAAIDREQHAARIESWRGDIEVTSGVTLTNDPDFVSDQIVWTGDLDGFRYAVLKGALGKPAQFSLEEHDR
jgi:hypothetical protein